jgi:glycosyltransferase involved in cell wall biosynthesis
MKDDGAEHSLKKPVILICCDWYEPGYKAGGPVQSVMHLADAISGVAEVYVLTSDRDLNEKEAYSNIPLNIWVLKKTGVRVMYLSPDKQVYRWYRKVFQEVNPDVLHMNSMWSIPFTLLPLLVTLGRKNIRKILSPRGMINEGSFRFKRIKKSLALFVLRFTGLLNGVTFHATDEGEKLQLIQKIPGSFVVVIPNLSGEIKKEVIPAKKNKGALKLVYVGRIAPQKNVHFILDLLMDIPETYSISFTLIGLEDNVDYSQKCRKIAQNLPSHISISFVGSLPHHEVQEKLLENHFLIQTSFSENFGHSVFEAFSCGRPVVISDGMPWKNLEKAHVGFDISLKNKNGFIEAILKAATLNQKQFDKMCISAYLYALDYVNSVPIKEHYQEMYSQ